MLLFTCSQTLFIGTLAWLLFCCWAFFFHIVFSNNVKLTNKDLSLCSASYTKDLVNHIFLDFLVVTMFFFLLWLHCFRGWQSSFFLDNFLFSNVIVFIVYVYAFFFFFLIIVLKQLGTYSLFYDFDFFFSLFNFFFFSFFFFFTKNFLCFFFLLEIISCFIFYQFIAAQSSSFVAVNRSTKSFGLQQSKQVLSVLFYQYWASFFSSVIMLYFVSNIIFFFGTTDWQLINYLWSCSSYGTNMFSQLGLTFFFFLLLFTFSFFIKLGFTPVQLFKIEIYKGLPFLSIFFYTFFYFFAYFFFFIFIFYIYFSSVWLLLWYIFSFIILVGSIYIINLLFDTKITKAFFAYSTVVNSVGFLCLFLIILS